MQQESMPKKTVDGTGLLVVVGVTIGFGLVFKSLGVHLKPMSTLELTACVLLIVLTLVVASTGQRWLAITIAPKHFLPGPLGASTAQLTYVAHRISLWVLAWNYFWGVRHPAVLMLCLTVTTLIGTRYDAFWKDIKGLTPGELPKQKNYIPALFVGYYLLLVGIAIAWASPWAIRHLPAPQLSSGLLALICLLPFLSLFFASNVLEFLAVGRKAHALPNP